MNQEKLKNLLIELDAIDSELKVVNETYKERNDALTDEFQKEIDRLMSESEAKFTQLRNQINVSE